ncbi:MAG: endonuclease III [Acidimicrobiia bacterium]|nr:endonuclease III [Acidimicrobiia bacterium]
MSAAATCSCPSRYELWPEPVLTELRWQTSAAAALRNPRLQRSDESQQRASTTGIPASGRRWILLTRHRTLGYSDTASAISAGAVAQSGRTETHVKKRVPVNQILEGLQKEYPDVTCALDHRDPLQLLVATILSAQCTDARVNMVTPVLFARYPTATELAGAQIVDLEKLIHSTGFFRNKAKNIKAAAQRLVTEFNGQVPKTMEALLTLPGVARKTANVVLGTAYGVASGVVVDTHVFRLSHRLGLTRAKTPEKVEQELMKTIPQGEWVMFSHRLIHHGRKVCAARNPQCDRCSLNEVCPKRGVGK